jgi:hypothetical protein
MHFPNTQLDPVFASILGAFAMLPGAAPSPLRVPVPSPRKLYRKRLLDSWEDVIVGVINNDLDVTPDDDGLRTGEILVGATLTLELQGDELSGYYASGRPMTVYGWKGMHAWRGEVRSAKRTGWRKTRVLTLRVEVEEE